MACQVRQCLPWFNLLEAVRPVLHSMSLIELIYMALGLVRQQFKYHRQPRRYRFQPDTISNNSSPDFIKSREKSTGLDRWMNLAMFLATRSIQGQLCSGWHSVESCWVQSWWQMATRGRTNGQKYPDLASGYISEAGVERHPNARKGGNQWTSPELLRLFFDKRGHWTCPMVVHYHIATTPSPPLL